MPIARALEVIDSHLLSSQSNSVLAGCDYATASTVQRLTGRDAPPQQMLPAFYVSWRDGPSPYDLHKGDYQCSVEHVLDDAEDFEVAYADGVSEEEAGAGQYNGKREAVLAELRDCTEDGMVANDYFRVQTFPARVTLNGRSARHIEEEVVVANPLRDRLGLEQEIAVDRTQRMVRRLKSEKASLYGKCVRIYPHGALGISESPYGNPGEVYATHQRQLFKTSMRQARSLRRPAQGPEDHLHGSYVCRGEERQRGIRCDPPPDHMHGGVRLNNGFESPVRTGEYQNSSSLFYVSK